LFQVLLLVLRAPVIFPPLNGKYPPVTAGAAPTFAAVGVVQVPAYVSHFVVFEVFNAGPFNTLLLSELSANNK